MINKATKKQINSELNNMSKRVKLENTSANIQAMVNNASKIISPVWPIETFIACNPLQGLESLPFEEAITEANSIFGIINSDDNLNCVNREMIKWCGSFLDMGQGTIEMPNRNEGFYKGFRALSIYDKKLHHGLEENKQWLSNLPEKAESAIELCLRTLNILENQEDFIKESLTYLPGWAGYIKWRSVWRNKSSSADTTPVTLIDFVAVRLVITTILWPDVGLKNSNNLSNDITLKNHLINKIEELEKKYSNELLQKILPINAQKKNKIK